MNLAITPKNIYQGFLLGDRILSNIANAKKTKTACYEQDTSQVKPTDTILRDAGC